MIGIDTNVLLRLWLDDDAAQARRITLLFAQHGTQPGAVLVTDVVLAEAVWTLQSAYGQGRAQQLLALRSLLDEPAFCFQDRASIERAVELFAQAKCGFSDCLVVAQHQRLGCEFSATFDRGMRQLPGVKVL